MEAQQVSLRWRVSCGAAEGYFHTYLVTKHERYWAAWKKYPIIHATTTGKPFPVPSL